MKELLHLLAAAKNWRKPDAFEREGLAGCTDGALIADVDEGAAADAFCKAVDLDPSDVGLILVFDEERLNVIHPEQGNEIMFALTRI